MRDAKRESGHRKFFSLCSRRIGKTTCALVDSVEDGMNGKDVRYCLPTLQMAEEIAVPAVDEILATCPESLRPKFSAKHLAWEWPDGMLKLGGADNRRAANRLRGKGVNSFRMDEACFFEEYEYVVRDVAMPQLFTSNGDMWMLSTPPESALHPSVKTINECRETGSFAHYDIWITRDYYGEDRIREFIEEAGGEGSTTAEREYYAKIVTDSSRAVIPEFEKHYADLVGEAPEPTHATRIVAADFGFRDLTVVAFGYYDFKLAKAVIVDEVVCQAQSALEVGRQVHAMESKLGWRNVDHRVADAPPQLLADIYEACGIRFSGARKDDAEAALNHLRRCCTEKRLLIHPRCKVIISHLQGAIWNASRTSYERSGDFGHFDGVDAVKYLMRHVDKHTDPYPKGDARDLRFTHHVPAQSPFNHPQASVWNWK